MSPSDVRGRSSRTLHPGGLRPSAIAVAVVLAALLLPAARTVDALGASPVTGLYLDSTPYDGVGRGYPEFWPSVHWGVTSVDGTGITRVGITAFGPDAFLDMAFSAPSGQHLTAGATYAGGVEVASCDPNSGGFTVHELDGSGPTRVLGISFWTACNVGTFHGELRINSAAPFAAIVPDAHRVDFPVVSVGGLPATKVITVASRGNAGLEIMSAALQPPTSDYTITSDTCSATTVAPDETCQIEIAYAPQNGGLRTATLVIDDNTTRGQHRIAVVGTATAPSSGLAWGSMYKAGPAYTWNRGGALGRTVQSSTQRLHLAYATNRIGTAWARDGGPYVGVYYTRSTSGTTWSTPKRLNPTTQHAPVVALAAAGSRVYVAWTSQRYWSKYAPTAYRTLYVRVNSSHGASTAWRSTVRLTSTTGRVDVPTIAAAGYDVYIAWTDSVTGDIRVAVSRDRGVTWSRIALGKTSNTTEAGRVGLPQVAVAGSTVAVAWRSDEAGTVLMRVSTNRGKTWATAETVNTADTPARGGVSVGARGTRIAVAWMTRREVIVRQRTSGTWADPVLVTGVDAEEGDSAYAPTVSLQDPGRVGLAWTRASGSGGASLLWSESADGGAHWFATQTIAAPASGRNENDAASVVWPSVGTRYVVWNGDTRLYLRKGTGTPRYVAP